MNFNVGMEATIEHDIQLYLYIRYTPVHQFGKYAIISEELE